jgi:hypothetical protein
MQMPTKGGRNATTNESRRGAGGMAPKPSGGAALPGNDRPSMPVQAGLARVKPFGGAPSAGSHLPVQNNAMRNQSGGAVGQQEQVAPGPGTSFSPMTRTSPVKNPVATNKSATRKTKGAAFYGEF